MTKKIHDSCQPLGRISDTGSLLEKVRGKVVAEALGAEPAGPGIELNQSPLSLQALRLEVADRLISSGGRPGLAGKQTQRKKIHLGEAEWSKLERLAQRIARETGKKASPAQVASLLLHRALEQVDEP